MPNQIPLPLWALVTVLVGCGTPVPSGVDSGTPSDAGTRLPSGLSQAVPVPAGAAASDFGGDLAMALDANGDPVLSYAWARPGGDAAAGAVYFARWDSAAGAWSTPVKVDTVGPIFQNAPLRHTAVAIDRSTGTIGVAYGRFNTRTPPRNELVYSTHLAISTDGGKTFTTELVSVRQDPDSGSEEAYLPALEMAGGKTHLVYFQRWQRCTAGSDCSGAWYLTRSGTSGAFARTLLPLLTGTHGNRALPLSLALDAQGKPGVAYLVREDTGYNTSVAFWRPDAAAAVKVFDSAGIQNDGPSVALAFDGLKPRILAALVNAAAPTTDLMFSFSDDGLAWSAPVAIPRDGGQFSGPYIALSIGATTVAASQNMGGASAGVCGAPKLSTSTNLTNWTTCGFDVAMIESGAGRHLNLRHTADGKQVMAFHYPNTTNPKVAPGVVVWRSP